MTEVQILIGAYILCDDMSNKELLIKLKEFIDIEFKQILIDGKQISIDVGACYTVSKVAVGILKHLGYNCRVQRVEVISGNKKGRELFSKQSKSGRYDKSEIIAEGGWIIGLGVSPQFHYIIVFPDEKEIMDLTFGQANRPQYELIAEPYWSDEKSLPETVIMVNLVIDEKDVPENFNPVFDYSKYRRLFKKIIKKGAKELQSCAVVSCEQKVRK